VVVTDSDIIRFRREMESLFAAEIGISSQRPASSFQPGRNPVSS